MLFLLLILQTAFADPARNAIELLEEAQKATEKLVAPTQDCPLCFEQKDKPGCSALFENFCDQLYSPEHKGIMKLQVGEENISLNFGKHSNGFSQQSANFQLAKLSAENRFPEALRKKLLEKNYFNKLRELTERSQGKILSQKEQATLEYDSVAISNIYGEAIRNYVIDLTEKKHPGFNASNPAPRAWIQDSNRIQAHVMAELYGIIWEKHPGWIKTKNAFVETQNAFIEMLTELKKTGGIPSIELERWIERVGTVKIEMPGQDEYDEDQDSCGSTQVNAYYIAKRNVVIVCAGDFTSEDPFSTLGHEIAHALGANAAKINFKGQSVLGRSLTDLRNTLCGQTRVDGCPEKWKSLKTDFDKLLLELEKFKLDGSKFMMCLQEKNPNPKGALPEVTASVRGKGDIRNLANRGALLSLTTPMETLADNTKVTNRDFLNPCESDQIPPGIYNIESSEALIYSLEYMCSTAPTPEAKIKDAADSTIKLMTKIYSKTIPMGGTLAPDDSWTDENYSEDVGEKFADALGQRAFARLLANRKENIESKRNWFFANNASYCDRPSTEKDYPKQALAQKSYTEDKHSEYRKRREELLVPEIRAALDCRSDTTVKECRP